MIFFSHFNRAVIQHLRAQRRKLQHLVIRIDLAQIGVHGSRNGHRARIAAAAAQRRHVVILVDALKARYNNDVAL